MVKKMISCELVENKKPRLFARAAVYEDSDNSEFDEQLYDEMNKKLDDLMCTRFRDTLAKKVPSFKNKPLEDIGNIINAMIALGWIEIKYDYQGWGSIEDYQESGAENAN